MERFLTLGLRDRRQFLADLSCDRAIRTLAAARVPALMSKKYRQSERWV